LTQTDSTQNCNININCGIIKIERGYQMSDAEISHQNQDIIYKYMAEFFRNETLEYYGLNLPKIVNVKPTELPIIQLTDRNMDYVFELEDSSLLHMEFQTTNKLADLPRFLIYDSALYLKENRKIHTAVIYSGNIHKADKSIDIGSIYYKVEQVFMVDYNGDERYEAIKHKIENDIQLDNTDIMDMVFLPLMKNKWGEDEAAKKVLELAEEIKDESMQSVVIATVLGLADKYVRKEYIDRLKEVVRMTRIGAALIEEGRKRAE